MKVSVCTVLHLDAGNDVNGNPRRLFMVLARGSIIATVNEGYDGSGALDCLGGRDVGSALYARVAGRISITPAEYRNSRKLAPEPPKFSL